MLLTCYPGKTHIAKRICRFLSFFHDIPSQIFNVGDYRRQLCGSQMPSHFYDHANQEGQAARQMACDTALADLIEYMKEGSGVRVAALDATNSTRERRRHILKTLQDSGLGVKKMFIESICDQEELLEENIRKVKLSTPDYRDMEEEVAMEDFRQRRAEYMKIYEPVGDEDGSYIKIINSKQFIGEFRLDDVLCQKKSCTIQRKATRPSTHSLLFLSHLMHHNSQQYSRLSAPQSSPLRDEPPYSSTHILSDEARSVRVQFAWKDWR
jgi:hypothetical protein